MPRKKKTDTVKGKLTTSKNIENFKELSLENEKLQSSYGSNKYKLREGRRNLELGETNFYKFGELKKNFPDVELKNIGKTFSFDAAYRGIKSSFLRQLIEEKCSTKSFEERCFLYPTSAKTAEVHLPPLSIDTVITRIKSMSNLVELTEIVRYFLKEEGLCVALLDNELLPFLFREILEQEWCYIWMLVNTDLILTHL